MVRWFPWLVLIPLAQACGEPEATGRLGTIAFSDLATGDLVVMDVETRRASRVATELAAAGSLSPDGREAAFAQIPEIPGRHVFVADRATAAAREIRPGTGWYGAAFRWGTGGWFWYVTSEDPSGGKGIVVTPGAVEGRRIGRLDTVTIVASPVAPLLAYADCTTPPPSCAGELVVEAPDGSDRRVLAVGAVQPISFTPDGSALVSYELVGGETHVVWRGLDGASMRDLGPAEGLAPIQYPGRSPATTPLLAPDGSEILTVRTEALVALRLDGGGTRSIVDERPARAAFTARGAVLYELVVNTTPGSDTPEYLTSLWVEEAGQRRPLRLDDPECVASHVSPSGSFVAFGCDGRTVVHAVADGSVVLEAEGLAGGFDRLDEGVVTASFEPPSTYTVHYVRLRGGAAARLGTAGYLLVPRGEVEWPPFDFLP